MKTIIVAAAIFLSAIPRLCAEQILWTWKPGSPPYRSLHVAAMDSEGSAVLIFGEYDLKKRYYRYVWLDASGKPLMDFKTPTNNEISVVLHPESIAAFQPLWDVSFLGKSKIRITSNDWSNPITKIYELKNGIVEVSKLNETPDNLVFFPAGGFNGWLKKETVLRSYHYNDGAPGIDTSACVVSVSACKP